MRVLIDECLPASLAGNLSALGYSCMTVRQAGLASRKNGELLALAEGQWDVFLTSDRNIKHQQNMVGRQLSIVILCARSNRMADLVPLMPEFSRALLSLRAGQIIEIQLL